MAKTVRAFWCCPFQEGWRCQPFGQREAGGASRQGGDDDNLPLTASVAYRLKWLVVPRWHKYCVGHYGCLESRFRSRLAGEISLSVRKSGDELH